jgi:O-antigen/teichoic acid export membrane protein
VSFARQSLGSLATLIFGVAVSILLPRLLGPDARAEYQLAVRVAGLVLAVAQWGIPEVLLQLLAEGRSATGTLIGTSLGLGLAAAALVAVGLGLAAPLFSDNLLRGVEPVLLWLALGGSLFSLVGLLVRRFIQLGGHIGAYNWLDVGRTLLFLVLVLLAGVLLPRQALGPTIAWVCGEVALAVFATAFLWRQVRGRGAWRGDRSVARELIRSGAPIQLGLVAMFIGSEGGTFVLNANLTLTAVGIYAVALSVARLVLQVSMALRTALQPRLVASADDSAAVTALVTRHALLWMTLLAIVLALGSPLAPVIFTKEFEDVGPVLVLLLPGMVAYGLWQLLASHLLRLGRRGLLTANAWFFAVTSIGLQAAGIGTLGLAGAALGLTVAYLLAAAVIVVAFARLSGRPARELVPVPSDLWFYVGLTRRALAPRST